MPVHLPQTSFEGISVPTLALLVVLLLVLITLLLAAGAAYVVHRHPTASHPLMAALGVVTAMVAIVGLILTR